jgi:tetratricopeptide (TPR) repeat protein
MSDNGIAYRIADFWTVTAMPDRTGRIRFADAESGSDFLTLSESKPLLENPAAAEIRARDILKVHAIDPIALYVLGAALNRLGRPEGAREILEPLTKSQPQMGCAWRELGFAFEKLANRVSAAAALRKALGFNYRDPDVLSALGDLPPFEDPPYGQELTEAAAAIRGGHFESAESILRGAIEDRPEDARAIKLLGDALIGRGHWLDASPYYERCLKFAPDFTAARFRYATMLFAHGQPDESVAQIDQLLKAKPTCALLHALKAVILAEIQQYDVAISEFETSLNESAEEPGLWLEYARALTAKRDDRAAAAVKRAVRILPSFVEAYVFYANVKRFRWDEEMLDQVRGQLARSDLAAEDRGLLHFALGRGFEDHERYAESFENYRACNEILRRQGEKPALASQIFVRRTAAVFNSGFLRTRAGRGCPSRDPIFIVGLKRSGSTLVEQILSRHSAIEALGELEDLSTVVGDLRGYPHVLKDLGADRFRAMGEEYVALANRHRKLGKPFFTDKLPHNFGRVGLIHLILPNAKIIDVRRHPLDCGFSSYKHYFPGGQLSLSLTDIAASYVDYVKLMAHFDKVLPGKVHRVIYERLIGNFEYQVRGLLDYLGLPFEEECLRFHEDTRRVLTPSVDQVRSPLYNTGVDYWRHYERWLGPMKEKLGYVLRVYPDVPEFYAELRVQMRKPFALGESGRQFALVRGLRQRRFENA